MRRKAPVAALFSVWVLAGAAAFGQVPGILVTPDLLTFGSVCVGKSVTKTMTIKNTEEPHPEENRDLTVDGISKSGTGAASFTFIGDTSFTLAPQESQGVPVRFTSQLPPGNRSPTFTVEYEGSEEESIKGFATVVHRLIAVDSATVSFGEQRVGTRSPTKTLIVRNPGQDAVQVTSIKRIGANGGDFVVAAPAVPFTIAAGDIRSVPIAFQPTGDGLRKATLEITSNSCTQPKLNVSLVGTGVIPNVVVQPNPIDVGTSSVGKAGKPTAVTISNEGAAALKITTIQIIGENAADFALTGLPPVPKTLQPDESFVFAIRMTPTEEGLRLASINVLSDDPDVPTLSIPVRGSATAASPSPSTSASPTLSPTASASPFSTASPLPAGTSSDSLAILLVVGGVISAFVGLMIVRRFMRTPEEE